MLIPHTLEVTTLGGWHPGHAVNLEVDVLARYAVHALSESGQSGSADAALSRALREAGYEV
jgi:riboflavin synthase